MSLFFLYDISKHKIEFGKLLLVDSIYDKSEGKFIDKVSLEKKGKKIIWKKVSVDKLLSFEPVEPENRCYYNDAGIYSIYLKNGSRERELDFDSPSVRYYKPFIWLIDICDSMSANGFLERLLCYLGNRFNF